MTNGHAEHAHLTVCVAPDGLVQLYPDADADPELLVRGLRILVEQLAAHPERIRCAAGACGGACAHHA